MVEQDFYALLDVHRGATEDELKQALKKKRRVWQKRVQAPDISARHEAEKMMADLHNAEAALLSGSEMRAQYDRDLAVGVKTAAPVGVPAGGGGTDWVSSAREALAHGDYHSAAYSAREATHTIGNSAESWLLRSRANVGLGQLQDALYEAKQGTTIEPNNPELHFHHGAVLEEMEQWSAAMSAYQVAAQLDPSNYIYQLAQGSVYAQNGLFDQAIDLFRRLLDIHPDQQIVRDYLAQTLFDKAENVPAVSGSDSYVVTNKDEIAFMRSLIYEAGSLSNTTELHKNIAQMDEYLTNMEGSTWDVHALFGHSSLRAVGIPLGLFVFGLILAGVSPGLTALFIVAAIGVGVLVFKLCWVPKYVASSRRFAHLKR